MLSTNHGMEEHLNDRMGDALKTHRFKCAFDMN
jgi:hypothetical protein